MDADVIIVGGGIVGCATAYHLARRGVSTLVVERGEIACEQSSRAWGFVRQQGRCFWEVPIAAEASRIWEGLGRDLGADLEFERAGIVAAAETEADEAHLSEAVAVARSHGLGTRMITAAEIRTLMPELRGAWRAALYTPEDGHAEPVKATRAFAAASERLGARILTGTAVLAIDTAAGAATGVVTSAGRYRGQALLLAGGADSRRLARTVGVDLPIQVIRSSVAQTMPSKPFTRTAFWGPKLAFRPKRDGSFYLGNGYRGAGADYDVNLGSLRHLRYFLPSYRRNWRRLRLHVGRSPFGAHMAVAPPEPKVNQSVIDHNHRQFHAAFPHLGAIGLARSWAGRIDLTPDLIPIIGACGPQNFYVAAGFSGHGFALAPVIGRLLAELIRDSHSRNDLHPFRYSRFAEGNVEVPSNVL